MTLSNIEYEIMARPVAGQEEILTPDALAFIIDLEDKFGARRRELMAAREGLQHRLDQGEQLDFPPETVDIRQADWTVRPAPGDLQDRRVEITGPVDRKMVINALNSGANAFMADFEDSNTPTWENLINGQINLRDANSGSIEFTNETNGKEYRLMDNPAVLMVRPRGLHMVEQHLRVGGQAISASLFDFGLYLFHNRDLLQQKGSGAYFYLPKLEHYLEARLWRDILKHAEDRLGLPRGAVRVTILIETITASFQLDEILYELKDHITALNCGRWDYIFSFIKKFSAHAGHILPDRGAVTMTCHFLRSYSLNLIRVCHRRGAHAMGGMAAQIPIKNDVDANRAAIEKFIADKNREATDGHDGTWVAHPGLVDQAREIFDRHMPGPNQLDRRREDVEVTAADLLTVPGGEITEAGLRQNINVGLLYLKSWLGGLGCVPLYHLMEDAATAEISRTQLWQWRRHRANLADGRVISDDLMTEFLDQECAALREAQGDDPFLKDAESLFRDLVMSDRLEDFLTTPAYDYILRYERDGRL